MTYRITRCATYADFKTVVNNRCSASEAWYVDMTAASGPFIIYNFVEAAGNLKSVVTVKLDSAPSTFSTDWATRRQLNAPLEFH